VSEVRRSNDLRRAGEEIAALDAAGIPVEIVPGITSGIALAAALTVSLTHRDHASSVRFVTGHSRQGGLPENVDWRAVADAATTTIFYMAGHTAGQVMERLAAHGLAWDTPIAVASSLSRPEQRRWRGALSALPAFAAEAGDAGPIVLGVGKAFRQCRQHSAGARPAQCRGSRADEAAAALAAAHGSATDCNLHAETIASKGSAATHRRSHARGHLPNRAGAMTQSTSGTDELLAVELAMAEWAG
jgi:16S rRNA C1402 (ribose-2'-O) methylase RsmI